MNKDKGPISNVIGFLNQNLKNDKEKEILGQIYNKYGPFYVLSALSKQDAEDMDEGTVINELDFNTYRIPDFIIQDYTYSGTPSNTLLLSNLGVDRWFSIRYDLSRVGSLPYCYFQWDYASTYRLTLRKDNIRYSDTLNNITAFLYQSVVNYDNTVQFNIGITRTSEVYLDIYYNRVWIGLFNLSNELGSSVSMLKDGTFTMTLGSDVASQSVTISYEEPIIECVSSSFLMLFDL